jgi:endonuclease/exonuclease/phosphatase family metal-dependent hydrolase
LRFVSYNIHRAKGTDGRRSIRRVADVLGGIAPDIAGLNEVIHVPAVNDQPARLARELGMTAAFQPNIQRRATGYGNLVLARGRLASCRRIMLPGTGEPRGLLVVHVELEGQAIAFAVTHLGLDRETRELQIAALADALPGDAPLVLVGDFNAPPEEMVRLTAGGGAPKLTLADAPPTFPAHKPTARIDHVLFSEHWRFGCARMVPSPASDHAALFVDLDLA